MLLCKITLWKYDVISRPQRLAPSLENLVVDEEEKDTQATSQGSVLWVNHELPGSPWVSSSTSVPLKEHLGKLAWVFTGRILYTLWNQHCVKAAKKTNIFFFFPMANYKNVAQVSDLILDSDHCIYTACK